MNTVPQTDRVNHQNRLEANGRFHQPLHGSVQTQRSFAKLGFAALVLFCLSLPYYPTSLWADTVTQDNTTSINETPPWLPPGAPSFTGQPFMRKAASYHLPLAQDIDLDSPEEVFAYVISQLPSKVDVIPTENYLYWRFHTPDKYIWGNIRLEPGTRDEGKAHIGYYEFNEHLTGPEEANTRYKFLDLGEDVKKIDDFTYQVTQNGKTVRFALNQVRQSPPRKFELDDSEVFVMRTEDESRIQFHLIFNRRTKNFLFVANEDERPLDHVIMVSEDLTLDMGSGFLFYVDRENNDRKILVGVYRRNIAQNNYYDGPADQLADNYIPDVPEYKGYLEEAYPFTRGVIDEYGFYIYDAGNRVAVAPYYTYSNINEVQGMIDVCKTFDGVSGLMACLIPGGMRPDQYIAQESTDDAQGLPGVYGMIAASAMADGEHERTAFATGTPTDIFFEDWEGPDPLGAGGWVASGLWHLTYADGINDTCATPDDFDFVSPNNSAYYGYEPACNYDDGIPNYGMLTSPVVQDLPEDAYLYVYSRRQTEGICGQRDISEIQISYSGEIDPLTGHEFPLGQRWESLDEVCDDSNQWQELGPISLKRYSGRDIQIRFFFDTVDTNNNSFLGWMVDDVLITAGENAAGPDFTAPKHMTGITTHLDIATFLPPGQRHGVGTTWHQASVTWGHTPSVTWNKLPNPRQAGHKAPFTWNPRPRPRPRPPGAGGGGGGGGGGGAPPPRKPPHMAYITWHLAGVTAPPPGAKHAAYITWHIEFVTFIPPGSKHYSGHTWHMWELTFIPPDSKHAAYITWHLPGITFIPKGTPHNSGSTWHFSGITLIPPGSKHAAGTTWHLPGLSFIPPGTKHNSGSTWHVSGETFIPPGSKHNSGVTWHVGGQSFIPPGSKHNSGFTWHLGGVSFIPAGSKHNSGITWHYPPFTIIPPGSKHNSGVTWHVGGQTFIPPGTKHNSGVTWHVGGVSFIPPGSKHNSGVTWHVGGVSFIPAGTPHNSGFTWHYAGLTLIPPGSKHNSGITWHYGGQTFIPAGTIHNSSFTWHYGGQTFIPAGSKHNSGITWHVSGQSFIPPTAKHIIYTTWHATAGSFLLGCPTCLDDFDCPPLDCYDGICNEGECSYVPLPAGEPCDDGDPASVNDACNDYGECIGLMITGTPCDDLNPCTDLDEINVSGICEGIPNPLPCETPNPCMIPGSGMCVGGDCIEVPQPAGLPCDDGDETTMVDICDGFGACIGDIAADPDPLLTRCNDGLACDGQEECDPLSGVVIGEPPICDGDCLGYYGMCLDDPGSMNYDCVGEGGVEDFDLPDDCLEAECYDQWDGITTDVDCDDGNPCTDDTCDFATGDCIQTFVPDTTPCDDEDVCTEFDECTAGVCAGTLIPGCTGVDCNNNGNDDSDDIASGFSEDCNANGIPDECDIEDGTTEDINSNGIPDVCEGACCETAPPTCTDGLVEWDCSMFGMWLPFEDCASTTCVACVDDPDCDDGLYCTGDESCHPDGVCLTGTSPCGAGENCGETPPECVCGLYGDVDNNGDANLIDLLCMLDGIAGVFDNCPGVSFEDLDLSPCGGNGDLNLIDLLIMLDAVSGYPNPCCGDPLPIAFSVPYDGGDYVIADDVFSQVYASYVITSDPNNFAEFTIVAQDAAGSDIPDSDMVLYPGGSTHLSFSTAWQYVARMPFFSGEIADGTLQNAKESNEHQWPTRNCDEGVLVFTLTSHDNAGTAKATVTASNADGDSECNLTVKCMVGGKQKSSTQVASGGMLTVNCTLTAADVAAGSTAQIEVRCNPWDTHDCRFTSEASTP